MVLLDRSDVEGLLLRTGIGTNRARDRGANNAIDLHWSRKFKVLVAIRDAVRPRAIFLNSA